MSSLTDQEKWRIFIADSNRKELDEVRAELKLLKQQVVSGDTVPRAEYESMAKDRDHWKAQFEEDHAALSKIGDVIMVHYDLYTG